MPTQLDIRAVAMYGKDIAPDIWQLHLGNKGAVQDRSFLIRVGADRRCGPLKGKSPRDFLSPAATRRTGPATPYVQIRTD